MKIIWLIMLLSSVICLCLGFYLGYRWNVASLVDEVSGEKAKRQIRVLRDIHSGNGALEEESTKDVSAVSSGTIITNGVQGVNTEALQSEEESTKDLIEDSDYVNGGYAEGLKYTPDYSDEPTGTLQPMRYSEVGVDLGSEEPVGETSKGYEEEPLKGINLEDIDEDEPTGVLADIDEDEPTGVLADIDEDEPTGVLGEVSETNLTMYAGGDEDIATSYLDEDIEEGIDLLHISIIEEQSSL